MEPPLIGVLTLWISVSAVFGQPLFFIAAPNVVHLGVDETVAIQIQDNYQDTTIKVYFEDENSKTICSQIKEITLGKSKSHGTVTLQVDYKKVKDLKVYENDVPYLMLAAEIPNAERKLTRVLLSRKRGYIFIQTKQPIYTPNENVFFRVFTLDHALRAVDSLVYIYVINSQGYQVLKETKKHKDGIVEMKITIPDVAESGTWKIKAHYEDAEETASIQQFEVMKMVLPSFEVKIKPVEMYYHIKSETFIFNLDVQYSYGKPVTGSAHARFAIIDDFGKQTFLKGLEQQQSVRDGEARFEVNSDDLAKKAQMKMEELNGFRFYIAVTVIETTSGELQEADMDTIRFTSSHYKVDLSKTRKYFVPSFPFKVSGLITFPDGSPAPTCPVEIIASSKNNEIERKNTVTNSEGTFNIDVNFPNTITTLNIKVKVSNDDAQDEIQVNGYKSTTNSYLYIGVDNSVIEPGQQIKIILKSNANNHHNLDRNFYYMFISKGQIQHMGKVEKAVLTQISHPVTADLVPSFRIIAYYYTQNKEIVADSVWVDIQDRCDGQLEIKTDKYEYSPGTPIRFSLDTGSENPKVALLAVDKAMYAFKKDNKVTLKQVFAAMNSYDLGCSFGGGSDNAVVFNDAGLTFMSDSVVSNMRKDYSCQVGFRRQKRSFNMQLEMQSKINTFSNGKLKQCCKDGFTLINMKITCEQRKAKVKDPECKNVFFSCCELGESLRRKQRALRRLSSVARTLDEDDEDYFDESSVRVRRLFPPSWLWTILNPNQKQFNWNVPDSITDWEVQAISFSPDTGFCIANPKEIRVFKKIFISLRLPYSVKRYEQLELRAVVFNYGTEEEDMAVYMKEEPDLCSSSSGLNKRVKVKVNPYSSTEVPFSVVPMVVGKIPIQIFLYHNEHKIYLDSIVKNLNVEAEGNMKSDTKTYHVDVNENTGRIDFDGKLPHSTVPECPSSIHMKIRGQAFTEDRVENFLSPDGIKHLLQMPTGCGEQTMIRMAPSAYATRYLDDSQQWVQLKPGLRDQALEFIRAGYTRILTFKKPDGSYGAWLNYDSSTWLTAFVAKVLSQIRKYTDVRPEHIEDAAKYLIKMQNEGQFIDPKPVIHREMQGGLKGAETDVSLTAFVTIALYHTLESVGQSRQQVEETILKASNYLESKLTTLRRPYALAITAYALALINVESSASHRAYNLLKSEAIFDSEKNVYSWEALKQEGAARQDDFHLRAVSVETTAYALLTSLVRKDMKFAESIYRWLGEQQNYGGGFCSTQDTVVAMEALAQFEIERVKPPPMKIDVRLSSPSKSFDKKVYLDNNAKGVEADLKNFVGNEINVNVQGKGNATITFLKIYHVMEPEKKCSNLHLEVNVKGKIKKQELEDYFYDDDYDNDKPQSDAPSSEIEWFDVRSRRRREVPGNQNTKNKEVTFEVCIWHDLAANMSGMAIVDITLLSGFEAHEEDLEKLKNQVDQYISHYETMDGRVILYFDGVPSERQCVGFQAEQTIPIGLLQPATATLYDYYEPGRRCTISYNAPKRSAFLSKLCSGDVCECAESPCHKEKKPYDMSITQIVRLQYACYDPIVQYGYTVRVLNVTEQNNFQVFGCEVIKNLKFNEDIRVKPGSFRYFLKRQQCKSKLTVNKEYLIMGNDGKTKDVNGNMQYLLNANTWIEELPLESKCKGRSYRSFCEGMKTFLSYYEVSGCTV
ncbi:complement C4-B [Erpetoichthys calabaricus]|uniref:complement C4-B n=1 Tax=Erpetoichthys calabaricus TaxID=27687 RepID=UPI0022341B02|nr:complement C4-B [Erpetoichthys calabaricus]